MFLKVCHFLGFAMVVIGILVYFFKRPDLSRILILLGAILWLPQEITGNKDDYIKDNRINFYWFSRFMAIVFFSILLIISFLII
jgi:hypothetical protein